MNLSFSKFVTSELFQEWIAHTTSNDDFISYVEHVEDKIDFVSNFEASQNDEDRFSRASQKLAKEWQLFFHEQTCHSIFVIDADHTRMSSMSATEGIIDIDVSQFR